MIYKYDIKKNEYIIPINVFDRKAINECRLNRKLIYNNHGN